MTCTTCTKVKPVSDCASSVVIGTIENAGADVIVTVNNVTLNRVDKYETIADGDGLITIEGIKLSRFTYEITVALASAPDLNIIWSVTDGSITQNVNCAVFKAASGGAEKLLPIPGSAGVIPNPPTGLGTNDIADESNYQEANLTDALNKIRVDAQQTQNSLQGVEAYLEALQLKKAEATFTFTEVNSCDVTPLTIATPSAPSKKMLPIAFFYTQALGAGDPFSTGFYITMTNAGGLTEVITATTGGDFSIRIPPVRPADMTDGTLEVGESFLLTSTGTGGATAGTVTITTIYIEI